MDLFSETPVRTSTPKQLHPDLSAWQLKRWIVHGLTSKVSGKRVFLAAYQLGNVWYTTKEAYARFNAELAAEEEGE